MSEVAALAVEGLTVSLPTRGGLLRAVRGTDLEVAPSAAISVPEDRAL